MLPPINPRATQQRYLEASVAIDEALEVLDPARVEEMRRLGGGHQPPGGPAMKFTDNVLAFLAEGLAGAQETIARQQERIDELEAKLALPSEAKAATK